MSNLQKMKQILTSSAFMTMETKLIRNIRRGFGTNSNEIAFEIHEKNEWIEKTIKISENESNKFTLWTDKHPFSLELAKKIEKYIKEHPSFSLRFLTGQFSIEIDPEPKVIDTFIGYDVPYLTRLILASTDLHALYNQQNEE